jgi:hypothetical protein
MTTNSAFSAEERKTIPEGPPIGGMIVVTAAHGGMFRGTFAMLKAMSGAGSFRRDGTCR